MRVPQQVVSPSRHTVFKGEGVDGEIVTKLQGDLIHIHKIVAKELHETEITCITRVVARYVLRFVSLI